MGAWGIRTFENDEASDWIADFAERPDAGRLARALADAERAASEPELYLAASAACEALAAAEVVAAWCGRPAPELPPQVTAWLLGRTDAVTGEVLDHARAAVRTVRERGELHDLWAESDEFDAWCSALEDLARRLGVD